MPRLDSTRVHPGPREHSILTKSRTICQFRTPILRHSGPRAVAGPDAPCADWQFRTCLLPRTCGFGPAVPRWTIQNPLRRPLGMPDQIFVRVAGEREFAVDRVVAEPIPIGDRLVRNPHDLADAAGHADRLGTRAPLAGRDGHAVTAPPGLRFTGSLRTTISIGIRASGCTFGRRAGFVWRSNTAAFLTACRKPAACYVRRPALSNSRKASISVRCCPGILKRPSPPFSGVADRR
jgi:hypothetical protein